jgi:hypothetical protein
MSWAPYLDIFRPLNHCVQDTRGTGLSERLANSVLALILPPPFLDPILTHSTVGEVDVVKHSLKTVGADHSAQNASTWRPACLDSSQTHHVRRNRAFLLLEDLKRIDDVYQDIAFAERRVLVARFGLKLAEIVVGVVNVTLRSSFSDHCFAGRRLRIFRDRRTSSEYCQNPLCCIPGAVSGELDYGTASSLSIEC